MKKHTRLFLFGAAGVLVVGLGTGLFASIVGVQSLGILPGNGPDELEFVPADVRMVAFANVADVMNSELRQKIREIAPDTDHDDTFQAETGINIETDLDYVVAFLAAGDNAASGSPTVLARGRFDEFRIRGVMEDDGATLQEYKGRTLIVNSNDRIAVSFVEPGLVVVGMPAGVRRAIDTKDSGTGVRDNDVVMQHIKDADEGNAWAVARFDALAQGHLPSEIANRLPKITWFSATASINGGIHGLLKADTRDEASAKDLQDVIRGFVALAKMQVGEMPAIGDLISSLQLGTQGTSVSLGFTISSDIIDALANVVPRPRAIEPPDTDQEPAESIQPTAETPTV
jgi:hypothetical protein